MGLSVGQKLEQSQKDMKKDKERIKGIEQSQREVYKSKYESA